MGASHMGGRSWRSITVAIGTDGTCIGRFTPMMTRTNSMVIRADGHFARRDEGHWRRSSGFGDKAHRAVALHGQWHVSSEPR